MASRNLKLKSVKRDFNGLVVRNVRQAVEDSAVRVVENLETSGRPDGRP